jgi:flagellar basal-body rod modification protein FlgD
MTTINNTMAAASAPSPVTGIGADYNTFLKLLTTQMQNQDPLDPMDTSEYTQQLAQYSQLEQSVQQTGTLKEVLAQLSAQEMMQASSFIGREARFDSPVAGLGKDPATWTYYVNGAPAKITGTITDASGAVVKTVTLDPATQGRFEWDGVKDNGSQAAEGAYTFKLTAVNTAGHGLDATINSVAKVSDVVSSGSGVMLGVNGIRMPLYGLVGISAPE